MTATYTAETVWRDFTIDGMPPSGVHKPHKSEIRSWGAYLETALTSLIVGGGKLYATKGAMSADLSPAANTMAIVLGDPTPGNNGFYRKIGAASTGSWSRVGDVPGYSFIKAVDAGAGTANAIEATAAIPIPEADGGALIALNIFDTNTDSPVTVAFNGATPLTIKTVSGDDVSPGALVSGMVVAGYKSGSYFRLLSDIASAGIQAAAEAAQAAAEAAQAAAEDARDVAAGYINDIVNEKEVPIYSTQLGMSGLAVPSGMNRIRVGGYSDTTLANGAADFKRVNGEPEHLGKFRTADRYLPNGSTDNDDGGWWEMDVPAVTPAMRGAVGYPVGTDGFLTAPDETDKLNEAISIAIALDVPLTIHGRWYRHNAPLLAQPTKVISHLDADVNDDPLTFWSTINAQQLTILGYGNGGFIAGATMENQLLINWPDTPAPSAQPQWCKFDGVKFNGNDFVTNANLRLEWSGNADITRCGFSKAGKAIELYGFAVLNIHHNDIGGYIGIDIVRGGDSTIRDNDIFVQNVGIIAAGNFKIKDNIFTGTNFAATDDLPRIGIVVTPVDDPGFPYSYGNRIEGNEFNALGCAVYGDASASPFRAIHMLTIANNHVVGEQRNTDIRLAILNNARNFNIYGNQINRDVQWISQHVPISLTDCEDYHVSDNHFNDIANSAVYQGGCIGGRITGNIFTNVARRANYVQHSEEQQSSPWSATNLDVNTGTTLAIAANSRYLRNGVTLQKLDDGSSNGAHSNKQTITTKDGIPYTLSAVVKADELTRLQLYIFGATATFNLSTQAVSNLGSGVTAGILDAGNGIYIVYATKTASGTSNDIGINLLNAAGSASYTGANNGLYCGGWSLSIGYSPTNYYGATDSPLAALPAVVELGDSVDCVVESNTIRDKYNADVSEIFVRDASGSAHNVVAFNKMDYSKITTPYDKNSISSVYRPLKKHYFKASREGSNQNVTKGGGAVKVVYNNTVKDIGAGFDATNSDWHPKVHVGPVRLSAYVYFDSGLVGGDIISIMIYKNGSPIAARQYIAQTTFGGTSITDVIDDCVWSDSYAVYVSVAGTGTAVILASSVSTIFMGEAG